MNKRVLQVSFDILIGESIDGEDLAKTIHTELEEHGLTVMGSGFQCDLTKEYFPQSNEDSELITEIKQTNKLFDRHYIKSIWEDAGQNVLDTIDRQNIKPMTGSKFLDNCTTCGGDWGGMLLSGIKELYPEVWEAIPDKMGKYAFNCICTILNLLDINFEE